MNTPGPHGPYETEAEARTAATASPGNHRMLCQAASAAGVELGAHDHAILLWLAGYEPSTCAATAGLTARAYQAGRHVAYVARDITDAARQPAATAPQRYAARVRELSALPAADLAAMYRRGVRRPDGQTERWAGGTCPPEQQTRAELARRIAAIETGHHNDTAPAALPAYDAAGELTALATWIDQQLADEATDGRHVAEKAADRVRDITLAVLGTDELNRLAGQQAPADPAPASLLQFTAADLRELADAELSVVRSALADAIDSLELDAAGQCGDCDQAPDGRCAEHDAALNRVADYRAMAAHLGHAGSTS